MDDQSFKQLMHAARIGNLRHVDIVDAKNRKLISSTQADLLEAFPGIIRPSKKKDPFYGYTPRKRKNGAWF